MEKPVKTPPELIKVLNDADIYIESVWDLVKSKEAYTAAIPILLDWLEHLDDRVSGDPGNILREGIVRALTVKEARPSAAPVMFKEFKKTQTSSSLRWIIGNALSVVTTRDHLDEILSICQDRKYGKGRQELVASLGRFNDPRVVPVLIDLLQDDDVVAHALEALRRLRPAGVKALVEPLLHSTSPLVRRRAAKTLTKLPN
jgi:HEAT repeat protein